VVNHADPVNATRAADVALAHQSVALDRYLFSTKSISPFNSNSRKLLKLEKFISNSNKIKKIQIIYQNVQKNITHLFIL
jgi:hypothetical protein